jgi:TolA-binding protein
MKKTIGMLVACIFFTVVAHAQGPQKEAVSIWEKIRNKIEKITPKQKPTVTTAVGGVRGAKTNEHELYWKGEEKPVAISVEEIDLFSSALQLAESGSSNEATDAFQVFLKQYPQSVLAGDAENALAELSKAQIATPQVPEGFSPPEDLPGFKIGM